MQRGFVSSFLRSSTSCHPLRGTGAVATGLRVPFGTDRQNHLPSPTGNRCRCNELTPKIRILLAYSCHPLRGTGAVVTLLDAMKRGGTWDLPSPTGNRGRCNLMRCSQPLTGNSSCHPLRGTDAVATILIDARRPTIINLAIPYGEPVPLQPLDDVADGPFRELAIPLRGTVVVAT